MLKVFGEIEGSLGTRMGLEGVEGIVDCRRFAIEPPDRRETREQVEQQLKLMKKVKESLGELHDTPIVVGLECTLIVLWNLYKT